MHGIAGSRIDGVTATNGTIVIEIAVVTAGSHADVGNGKNLLEFFLCAFVVEVWFGDTNTPRFTFGVDAMCDYFSAYVHEVVVTTVCAEDGSYHVAGLSFGNCSAVNLYTRVGLNHMVIKELDFVKAHKFA